MGCISVHMIYSKRCSVQSVFFFRFSVRNTRDRGFHFVGNGKGDFQSSGTGKDIFKVRGRERKFSKFGNGNGNFKSSGTGTRKSIFAANSEVSRHKPIEIEPKVSIQRKNTEYDSETRPK